MCEGEFPGGCIPHTVDFKNVSTVGLESLPVAGALAGLRANEARYYKNKYDHDFTVQPADEAPGTLEYVHRILSAERNLVISSRPLEVSSFEVDGLRMAYVFYESGLAINVMYGIEEGFKRAVGFKLSDGMDVPGELASTFQVRAPEVEARWRYPWLLLCDQGPVLRGTPCLSGVPCFS
jgi:hypothetical protein